VACAIAISQTLDQYEIHIEPEVANDKDAQSITQVFRVYVAVVANDLEYWIIGDRTRRDYCLVGKLFYCFLFEIKSKKSFLSFFTRILPKSFNIQQGGEIVICKYQFIYYLLENIGDFYVSIRELLPSIHSGEVIIARSVWSRLSNEFQNQIQIRRYVEENIILGSFNANLNIPSDSFPVPKTDKVTRNEIYSSFIEIPTVESILQPVSILSVRLGKERFNGKKSEKHKPRALLFLHKVFLKCFAIVKQGRGQLIHFFLDDMGKLSLYFYFYPFVYPSSVFDILRIWLDDSYYLGCKSYF